MHGASAPGRGGEKKNQKPGIGVAGLDADFYGYITPKPAGTRSIKTLRLQFPLDGVVPSASDSAGAVPGVLGRPRCPESPPASPSWGPGLDSGGSCEAWLLRGHSGYL